MQLLIAADDLTGSADCAARCHKAGLVATILADPTRAAGIDLAAFDVVSLNFDSRHLPAHAAAEKVRTGLQPFLKGDSQQIIYKKIDSTLRGNLGAEIEAILALLTTPEQHPCAVISPGFPAQARGMEHGALVYSHSHEERYLPSMLAEQTDLPVASIELADVRRGEIHLAQCLRDAVQNGAQLLVVDGLSDSDLQAIVSATRKAIPFAMLCGSAGLVLPLAAQMAQEKELCLQKNLMQRVAHESNSMQRGGRTLAIVGSGSEMAHRQISFVKAQSTTIVVELDRKHADEVPVTEHNYLLHLPRPTVAAHLDGPSARALATSLADFAHQLMERLQPAVLILVGGDTAQMTLAQLGIRRLDVIDECLPGMPLSLGMDAQGVARRIVLKAGNHGDEASLLILIEQGTCLRHR